MKEQDEYDYKLTPAQEKFVEGLMAGKSQYDAYIVAYPSHEKWRKEFLCCSGK